MQRDLPSVDTLIDVFRGTQLGAVYPRMRLVCRRFREAVAYDEYHAARASGLGYACYAAPDDPRDDPDAADTWNEGRGSRLESVWGAARRL